MRILRLTAYAQTQIHHSFSCCAHPPPNPCAVCANAPRTPTQAHVSARRKRTVASPRTTSPPPSDGSRLGARLPSEAQLALDRLARLPELRARLLAQLGDAARARAARRAAGVDSVAHHESFALGGVE
eukprot:5010581-Prymnesium_polylepis.1